MRCSRQAAWCTDFFLGGGWGGWGFRNSEGKGRDKRSFNPWVIDKMPPKNSLKIHKKTLKKDHSKNVF
jgi:hypothetical protein